MRSEPSSRQVIQADDIRTALCEEESQDKSAQGASTPILPVTEARIEGKLDLSNLVVEKPVQFQNCYFVEEVDLTYCEFKQVVDFSDCTFHQGLNSGDKIHSRTVYRKDLICNGATFNIRADFNGAHIEGSAYFSWANFRTKEAEVDFSWISVEGNFECIGATFTGPANFTALKCDGMGLFSLARFGCQDINNQVSSAIFDYASIRYLDCTNSIFKGGASFSAMECSKYASFGGAKFFSTTQLVNFADTKFGATLSFEAVGPEGPTIFFGPVSFDNVACAGPASFIGVQFEGEGGVSFVLASFGVLNCKNAIFRGSASFNSMRCDGTAFFNGVRFEGHEGIDFISVSLGGNLECSDALFEGPAYFNNMECPGTAFFNNARFNYEVVQFDSASVQFDSASVQFNSASFATVLDCQHAVFKGSVSFDSLKCEHGSLSNAYFLHKIEQVSFRSASFGILECEQVEFLGPVDLQALKCRDSARFNDTYFESANFTYASFGGDLECNWAWFMDQANFIRLKCGASGLFSGAQFRSATPTSFDLATFGGNLGFIDARFDGPVTLNGVQVTRQLQLSMTRSVQNIGFKGTVDLMSARIGQITLGESFPFAKSRLNLHECTFESLLAADDSMAKQFTEEQRSDAFSRDPYLQLEKYYEKVGKDAQAREIYYQGRRTLSRNNQSNTSTSKAISDWFLRWFVGYGVRTHRIVWVIVVTLVAGVAIFLPSAALDLKETSATDTQASSAEGSKNALTKGFKNTRVTLTSSAMKQEASSLEPALIDRVFYGVDVFMPVDLRVEENWTPKPLWRRLSSYALAIAGWLLIPLFFASWTGLVRSR